MPNDQFRAAFVAEARSWISTPLVWQQRTKGRGTDCIGWLVESAKVLDRPEADSFGARITGDHMGRVPIRELREWVRNLFDPTDEPALADILIFKLGRPRKPQHFGLYVGNNRMIHCYGDFGVVEVPMGKIWWGALHSAWTWRERVNG